MAYENMCVATNCLLMKLLVRKIKVEFVVFFSSLFCKTTEKNHAANKMKQRRVHVIPNNECDVCLQ